MTCYLRLQEIVVGVHRDVADTDWDEVLRRWRASDGVSGRDAALDAMPVTTIEVDDLPANDLAPFAGLIVSGRCDQQVLHGMRSEIGAFIARGRTVVFSGRLTTDWLPGAPLFQRHDDGPWDPEQCAATFADDTIFSGVAAAEANASFLFPDGRHPAPADATPIALYPDGLPGAYLDTRSGGAVLVHGGANLLATATAQGSSSRIVPQLVQWIADQRVGG